MRQSRNPSTVRLANSLRITMNLLAVANLFCLSALRPVYARTPPAEPTPVKLPFVETFESDDWEARGWYDDPTIETTEETAFEGKRSCVWHWRNEGDVHPGGKGGRVLFEPVESVTLSFAIRHSENWIWPELGPHELHFMTTRDSPNWGPAWSHLTLYIEVVNGKPRCAVQDSRNIDTTALGKDLTEKTEKRAVGGGNGDPDGHGAGGYYRAGQNWRNGRHFVPEKVWFSDEKGPLYKGDWHRVKARFKLNSIGPDGRARRDGVLQYWYDNELVMDYQDMVFRTGENEDMKINQFLMLPYFGARVPHAQKIWIDDLKISK